MAHSYRIFRSWIWELLSLAVAIGLIIAIAVLLATYNGKSVPNWGNHINLNALLALLSTILRAMVVVVLAQIISQRKWEWYDGERARPLSDLQHFDTGSRGAWGAILLIPTVVFKDFVTLVAAIVLGASFLVGPFVQQASRTTECSFPLSTTNASIPFAHYVPGRGNVGGSGTFASGTTPDTTLAVLMSAAAPDNADNQVKINCITGNCTFPIGDPQDSRNMRRKEHSGDHVVTTHSTVGMCNKCTDVTSLIFTPSRPAQYNRTEYTIGSVENSTDPNSYTASEQDIPYQSFDTVFVLPNNFSISYSTNPARIQPTEDLEWMGDMLTPELRTMARWSYVNATFIAMEVEDKDNSSAAVCVLYPCLRTYTASVTNNQLVEENVRSEPMQMSIDESAIAEEGLLSLASTSTSSNSRYDFVAVKSPCRAGNDVYELSEDGTSNISGTNMSLYDFTYKGGPSPKQYSHRNISAPPQCIYRHNGKWAGQIADLLQTELFDGQCRSGKGQTACEKRKQAQSVTAKLGDMGVGSVLGALAQDGTAVRVKPFSEIAGWFDSFADAMTNRFRSEFGTRDSVWESPPIKSQAFGSAMDIPPNSTTTIGEVHGLAWQSTVCVAMSWEWLLLPIGLTLITALLSLWTILSNWRHRRTRPVWKDNILPLLFYGHKFESTSHASLAPQQRHEHGPTNQPDSLLLPSPTTPSSFNSKQPNNTIQEHSISSSPQESSTAILLETTEMKRSARKIPITFHWSDIHHSSSSSSSSSSTAHDLPQEKTWFRRRTQKQREGDSLLETGQETGPEPETSAVHHAQPQPPATRLSGVRDGDMSIEVRRSLSQERERRE